MIDWVRDHGGSCHAETRIDKVTGTRGLYTTKDFPDHNEPILRIPNKLIVSPHHIKNQIVNGNWGDDKSPAFTEKYLDIQYRKPG